MNQVTNLIQWKNLTQEQKDEFDFENYKYGVQAPTNTTFSLPVTYKERPTTIIDFGSVYRLVIEDDKWYYCADEFGSDVKLGKDLPLCMNENLRPARPDEIPQDEKTLEQKIQDKWPDKEVVMLEWEEDGFLCFDHTTFDEVQGHIAAQSMKGFYKYVYEQGNDLIASLKTLKSWKWKTIQPVAVLFEE